MLLEGSTGCDCSAELKRKESERIQERIESLENLENDLKYKLDYESQAQGFREYKILAEEVNVKIVKEKYSMKN